MGMGVEADRGSRPSYLRYDKYIYFVQVCEGTTWIYYITLPMMFWRSVLKNNSTQMTYLAKTTVEVSRSSWKVVHLLFYFIFLFGGRGGEYGTDYITWPLFEKINEVPWWLFQCFLRTVILFFTRKDVLYLSHLCVGTMYMLYSWWHDLYKYWLFLSIIPKIFRILRYHFQDMS